MFSIESFYLILYKNILQPARFKAGYFYPFGSTSAKDLQNHFSTSDALSIEHWRPHRTLFYDQEPLFENSMNSVTQQHFYSNKICKLLANSEHSPTKNKICKENNFIDWYYFFHGFAALNWYRDFQYLPTLENKFDKVFITYNRLTTKDRSYRLILVSKILEQELRDYGHISLILKDQGFGTWQDEVNNPTTKLPEETKPLIEKYIGGLTSSLIIDQDDPQGFLSAEADANSYERNQSALWHVVTETIFYYDKQHLTEKIFKPIIAKRPFILVGAVNNLAYLKSYGFKTFDRWIDESYDAEPDPVKRIDMVVAELKKLCSLSMQELKDMHQEMKEVLEYNFNHFYGGNFKDIIVEELVDNFANAVHQWNHARITDNKVDLSQINLDAVKQLLKK